MASGRKTLALTLNITNNWIGGTYYILNLIRAMNRLPDEQKPLVVILSPEQHALQFAKTETGYPYLHFIRSVYSVKSVKGIINRLLKKKVFIKKITVPVDVLYPAADTITLTDVRRKKYWIPDFQEHYFPDLFAKEELEKRRTLQTFIAEHADNLVLSSEDAKKDFTRFYPHHKCRVDVLQFAVTNPSIGHINSAHLLHKYELKPGYFFIANQFWVHKNHLVLLEAIKKLKDEGFQYQFVFTGNTNDYRSAKHFEMLKQKVNEWGIDGHLKFLGFIDRIDQLVLMNQAECIIQPSLFEGWGTVIEDAKSMNKHIIASDIDVHKEQLTNYPHLMFEKNNSNDLGKKIKMMIDFCREPVQYDYGTDISRFAKNILKVLLEEETVPLTMPNS